MALPRWLARFNVAFTNRLMVPIASWLPYFGVVEHVGRSSGQRYRTPVNVFRHGDRYVFALTYGPRSQWVSNVETAGGCMLVTGGRRVRLVDPRRFTDTHRRDVLAVARPILGLLSVSEFLELRRA
jgi:deazaflavin-dependent oxidoreductase (nitroreductase family)